MGWKLRRAHAGSLETIFLADFRSLTGVLGAGITAYELVEPSFQ